MEAGIPPRTDLEPPIRDTVIRPPCLDMLQVISTPLQMYGRIQVLQVAVSISQVRIWAVELVSQKFQRLLAWVVAAIPLLP